MAAHSRLGSPLALERIQHPQRRPDPCLLRRRRAGRIESRLHRGRRPRNRPRQPPPAGRSRHRRCANPAPRSQADSTRTSSSKPRAADADPRGPSPRRRPNHRRARPAARRANRRLHPRSRRRSQPAHRRRLPRRLARNRQAHRRNRRWPHALDSAPAPQDLIAAIGPGLAPAATPSAKRCFRNSNRSFPTRANSSTRSTPPTPSKPVSDAVLDAARARPLVHRTQPARRSRRSQPPSVARLRAFTAIHSGGRRLHAMPAEIFSSRIAPRKGTPAA